MTATGQGNANRGMWIGLALLKIPQSQPVGVVSAAHFNFSLLHIPVFVVPVAQKGRMSTLIGVR